MTVIAMLGAKALWLLYLWLLSAIVASYLSGRKGYGEHVGLATGLLLHLVGVVVWLVWPAREESKWRTQGPFTRARAQRQPAADRAAVGESSSSPPSSGSS